MDTQTKLELIESIILEFENIGYKSHYGINFTWKEWDEIKKKIRGDRR